MSITPAFLDELRSRVPISELVGRFVSWDQRKSQPAKGDYWAPCPFHSEKTASFHVDDTKGFYYCFGCQAKGDIVGFLKEKANMDFVEAVRELTEMAGMKMPEYRPENAQKQDFNARLIEMHETAKKFFSMNLASSAGVIAREYLTTKRRLSDQIIQDFGIGYAANSRDALITHLKSAGYNDNEIVQGGLAIKPDDGGQIYDRFRNRIMFPIQDLRSRTIAFGGRAMDPNARAKYLNSPESPIFHKGRIVYNLSRARNHVRDDAHIIITEGYMDVIALAQAGILTGVAPMGTAITMDQVDATWKIDPRPIAAFDGDGAGQRAAKKLSLMALPQISAEKSLRFVLMPEGLDPDDFIQKRGANEMNTLLKNALPMVDMIWRGAVDEMTDDTPEARTTFDKTLRTRLRDIQDQDLRKHYGENFAQRRAELFQRPSLPPQTRKTYNAAPQQQSRVQTKQLNVNSESELTLALLLKCVLAHPELASDAIEELSQARSSDAMLDQLRKDVIMNYANPDAIRAIHTSPSVKPLEKFSALSRLKITKPETPIAVVRNALQAELERIARIRGLDMEIEDIKNAIQTDGMSEALNKRLAETMNEKEKIYQSKVNNAVDNGDSASFLRQFLESEGWRK